MNRILQCRKVPILAPRRFLNPKRVGKIGEIKEILRVKIHSLKEAGKNFILNYFEYIAYLSFYGTVYLAIDLGYKIYIRGDSIIWSFILDDKQLKLLLQEPAAFAGVVIGSYIVSNVLFQPLAEWAGSSQKRIKQLLVRCVVLLVFAKKGVEKGLVIFFRYAIQSRQGYPIT
jgi:hypothetical protein